MPGQQLKSFARSMMLPFLLLMPCFSQNLLILANLSSIAGVVRNLYDILLNL